MQVDETLVAPFLFQFGVPLFRSGIQMASDARKRRLRWFCFDKLPWKDISLDKSPPFHLSSTPRVPFFGCELYPEELKAAAISHCQVVFEIQECH